MIAGVDVSSVQGRINWGKVAAAGVRFAYTKCGQGNDGGKDYRFSENVAGCKDSGVYVGAYWFAYSLPSRMPGDGRTPQEEARRFFFLSGGLGRAPGELPPAIDAEWPEVENWAKWSCSAKQISEWQRVMAEEVSQLWGRAPVIYTYPHWWRTVAASADVSWAAQYPLWIANYMGIDGETPPTGARPYIPRPWDEYLFWQWSANKGRHVDGIASDVDRNVFRGDLDALRRLAGINPDAETVRDFEIVHPSVPVRGFDDDG